MNLSFHIIDKRLNFDIKIIAIFGYYLDKNEKNRFSILGKLALGRLRPFPSQNSD